MLFVTTDGRLQDWEWSHQSPRRKSSNASKQLLPRREKCTELWSSRVIQRLGPWRVENHEAKSPSDHFGRMSWRLSLWILTLPHSQIAMLTQTVSKLELRRDICKEYPTSAIHHILWMAHVSQGAAWSSRALGTVSRVLPRSPAALILGAFAENALGQSLPKPNKTFSKYQNEQSFPRYLIRGFQWFSPTSPNAAIVNALQKEIRRASHLVNSSPSLGHLVVGVAPVPWQGDLAWRRGLFTCDSAYWVVGSKVLKSHQNRLPQIGSLPNKVPFWIGFDPLSPLFVLRRGLPLQSELSLFAERLSAGIPCSQ